VTQPSPANPSRPIKTVLVGFGYWGVNMARNLAAARSIELVGMVDPLEERQRAFSVAYPGRLTWTTFDQALGQGGFEAVVIASPPVTHAEMALAAIARGCHVMVEKPLALTIEDAERVAGAADRARVVAMVGHTFLYSPPVRQLRQYVVNGELGRIHYLYSQRLNLGKVRQDCDALWNFGPHDVAIMLYLLDDSAVEVTAKGFSFLQGGIDDVCFASITFASGVGANLHVSWIDPRKVRLMTIVGDRKMAVYNDVSPDQKISLYDAGVSKPTLASFGEYSSMGEFQWRTRAGDIVIPNVAMREPLLEEVECFGWSCQSGEIPPTNARHGVEVVRILTAIEASASSNGKPVSVAS
jgi:predicted dehydrogenase